jgi:hypothetical protein
LRLVTALLVEYSDQWETQKFTSGCNPIPSPRTYRDQGFYRKKFAPPEIDLLLYDEMRRKIIPYSPIFLLSPAVIVL